MPRVTSYLSILVLTIIVASCSAYRNYRVSQDIYAAELINAPINDTIQPLMRMNLFIVYVKVNNHPDPLEFMFDTGANLTVISTEAAQRLGLEQVGEIDLGDSRGSRQTIPLVNLDTLQLGKGLYTDVIAAVYPLSSNPTISCITKDGILGYHVIRQLNWDVRPGDTLLIGSSVPFDTEDSYDVVSMTGVKAPYLNITFNNLTYGGVLFDTGSNGGLDLEMNKIVPHLDSKRFFTKVDGNSQGLFGNQIDTIHIADDTIKIGESTFLTDVEFGSLGDRKIGMAAMRTHNFIIAGQTKQLFISKEQVNPNEPAMTYGMVPGLTDSVLYVASIEPHGQAIEKGLAIGQVIDSFNGVSGSEIADMDCGFTEFLVKTMKSENQIELITASGDTVLLEKSIPNYREFHVVE